MPSTSSNPIVFIGTYTEHEGSQSKGIYVYRMNPTSGALTFVWETKDVLNPSYLEIHPTQPFLYAVNEVQSFASERGGGVSAFAIDLTSGVLNLVNAYSSRGEDPCYISIEQTGCFALVANYTGGNAAMFPIQADGQLGSATGVVQHSGSGVDHERQAGPHAHCILPDPTNRFAIAVDLGVDKLIIYEMDLERGKLKNHSEVKVRAGAGPRHLTFHPNRQYAYLINELNSTLICYRYRAENGTFEELQTIATLPQDFKSQNLCADVHVSPDEKHLYASNRGHDSIVCYFIDENTGKLTYRNHTFTGGKEPRNFAIDPTGSFLLAANQRSDNVVLFQIDASTGGLLKTGYEIKVSQPVCIKFTYWE